MIWWHRIGLDWLWIGFGWCHYRAKLLDTEELCVRSAKGSKLLVWCVIVDLYCLDNDGSLFDACVLALVASLRNSTPFSRQSRGS